MGLEYDQALDEWEFKVDGRHPIRCKTLAEMELELDYYENCRRAWDAAHAAGGE